MAKRGLAYNLKRAPDRVIEQCKLNVQKRLNSKFEVYKEVDITSNDILLDYPAEEEDCAASVRKENGSLIITDEEIRAKIDQIKNKKQNGLHQAGHHEKNYDCNNNIVNNLLSENSLLKER